MKRNDGMRFHTDLCLFLGNLEWKKGQNNLISECVHVKFPDVYKVKHCNLDITVQFKEL